MQQYRRALALDESFAPARLVLALALLEAGRFQESAQEVERW